MWQCKANPILKPPETLAFSFSVTCHIVSLMVKPTWRQLIKIYWCKDMQIISVPVTAPHIHLNSLAQGMIMQVLCTGVYLRGPTCRSCGLNAPFRTKLPMDFSPLKF